MDRKSRKGRRDLLISSAAQGKATGKVREGAPLSEGDAPGKIVIHGWTGERFVPRPSDHEPGRLRQGWSLEEASRGT
jgi:hypothetical protein